MHFKHPEFLYALFALLIPVLIHLFQLRKFRKIEFSNVQFLKAVSLQTRKSSILKKLLILITRMLLFACVIIAFAQPFFTNEEDFDTPQELVIYLDNSFSMEAKGQKGPLLKRAVQDIIQAIPEHQIFTLFTNTEVFKDVTKKDILNDLLKIDYSPNQLSYAIAYLKAKKLFKKNTLSTKKMLLISDFQNNNDVSDIGLDKDISPILVQLTPETKNNIAIDTLYIEQNQNNDFTLLASVSSTSLMASSVPISLYNDDRLLAKSSVSFVDKTEQQVSFSLSKGEALQGKLVVRDPNLSFDNIRYLTINSPKKTKVVTISGTNDDFLRRIYTEDEFLLTQSSLTTLNYNAISQADLIILNEIDTIPITLLNTLKTAIDRNAILGFIPSHKGELKDYNLLMNELGAPKFAPLITTDNLISTIHFDHPLFIGVFDKKIDNFQYPKVTSYFPVTATNSILSYTDDNSFLYNYGNTYIFTASIASEYSNFKNTSLIVPVFYNIGKESLQRPILYYQIGKSNSYDIQESLDQDEIVALSSEQETIIPLQQNFSNKVRITTEDTPKNAGIFTVKKGEQPLGKVAYNYNSTESKLQYHTLATTNNYSVEQDITVLFEKLKENSSVQEFWKWFIIFALIFLLIEILLLKYLK
ncbi:BatA and WFA domain-containing protein [Aquimarina sp. W85]|uniref:vWA domain-containing protein n=1 Tax=Aquimarina rhodophyticola TaxID=3342246 RepID=UPI0036717959